MQDNIIKKTCKDLGLTYRELGEAIGYSESNINKVASTGQISNQLKRAIELYLENLELKNKMKDCKELQRILKRLTTRE